VSRESLIELLKRAGVNRPVFYSMLTRGAQAVAALLGLLLVARLLDRTTQGYYFAILGFVAFVQLAEFGLTYAVMQSASHEAAAARYHDESASKPDPERRLAALLRGATRFNATITFLGALVIGGVGTRMLVAGQSAGSSAAPTWLMPWFAALLAVAATQLLNPRVSLLEGAGFVSAVWAFRFAQEVAAAIALWTALLVGWGLWAIALSYATRVVIGVAWLNAGWRRKYFADLAHATPVAPRDGYWWREVWPFQWRIGVSALSGYLIFQFFTPLIFAIKGPAIAGQFGMTLALTNGLLTATTAWLSSQAPLFGQLIATRSYDELDRAFVRSLRSSFLLVLLVGLAISALVAVLDRLQHPLAQRVLPPVPFALFVAATILNHVIFAMAIYLRAHRREPLMITSVIGAVATPAVVAFVGQRGGVDAIAASYVGLTAAGLGITAAIFFSRSRAWHVRPV
jgi:O-antigen/teichoic acid export membrane protein